MPITIGMESVIACASQEECSVKAFSRYSLPTRGCAQEARAPTIAAMQMQRIIPWVESSPFDLAGPEPRVEVSLELRPIRQKHGAPIRSVASQSDHPLLSP